MAKEDFTVSPLPLTAQGCRERLVELYGEIARLHSLVQKPETAFCIVGARARNRGGDERNGQYRGDEFFHSMNFPVEIHGGRRAYPGKM